MITIAFWWEGPIYRKISYEKKTLVISEYGEAKFESKEKSPSPHVANATKTCPVSKKTFSPFSTVCFVLRSRIILNATRSKLLISFIVSMAAESQSQKKTYCLVGDIMIAPKDFDLSPTKDRQINLQLNFPDVGRVFNVTLSLLFFLSYYFECMSPFSLVPPFSFLSDCTIS